MILGSSIHFGSRFSMFEFSVEEKVNRKKREVSEKALNKFIKKHICCCNTCCSFTEICDILIARGADQSSLTYSSNDFTETLTVKLDDCEYTLRRALFPKQKLRRHITFSALNNELSRYIEGDSTADSVADFLLAVHKWVPEYLAIEEDIKAEEERRALACRLSLDLLKRRLEAILKGKGYDFHISHESYNNIAKIRIELNSGMRMNIDVDLMEDFLERLTQIIESLPDYSNDCQEDI